MKEGAEGDKADPEAADGGPEGANGGGGGREKFGFVFDDGNDAAADADAADADADDAADADDVDAADGGDDSKLVLNSLKEDLSISVVTIFLFISMIAAISCPIDGSPESLFGTLLKSSDANLGMNRA